MRVNFEDVIELKDKLRRINYIPFDHIEWYKDGKPVEVSAKVKEDWGYIGLSNTDFPFYTDE